MGAEGKLEFYCGALGSGKTSFAFERALEHLLKGGTVVTNIEFYPEVIREWMHRDHGLVFDPDRLIRIEDCKDVWKHAVTGNDKLETMLLIDETHVEHNARDHKDTNREQVMFNTMVRKLKVHLVYITQDMENVDKQFRRMCQMLWYCRNAKQMPAFLGFIPVPFNLFIRVPYTYAPGMKPRMGSPEVCIRPLSWGMFNSHSLVGKAKGTFGVLAAAKDSPLERIARPAKPFDWPLWGSLAASLLITLS